MIAAPCPLPGGGKQAVEAGHARHIGAGAGKIEHAQPAEAKADRGDLGGIDLRLRTHRVEHAQQPVLQQGAVLAQRLHERHRRLTRGRPIALAVEIDAECGIAERHQLLGRRDILFLQAEDVGEDQDGGTRTVGAVRDQEAFEFGAHMAVADRPFLDPHSSCLQQFARLRPCLFRHLCAGEHAGDLLAPFRVVERVDAGAGD